MEVCDYKILLLIQSFKNIKMSHPSLKFYNDFG